MKKTEIILKTLLLFDTILVYSIFLFSFLTYNYLLLEIILYDLQKQYVLQKKNIYLTIPLYIRIKKELLAICDFVLLQNHNPCDFGLGVPSIFHVTCDKFVERTDWLSHEELLGTPEIFRGGQ